MPACIGVDSFIGIVCRPETRTTGKIRPPSESQFYRLMQSSQNSHKKAAQGASAGADSFVILTGACSPDRKRDYE